ncbi:MAG: hypothetical protein KKF54_07320 [Candidatus Omnitrophica bacterium]|nr:hypothetical protein [Candidatus Omnitrophota bacterium]
MSQVRDRLTRINALLELHKEKPELSDSRLVDEMCVISGVRPRRVQEYMDMLKRCGKW